MRHKNIKTNKIMLKNIFLLIFLFFSLNFSFSQEGSGNWKKGQTDRQTELFVPANSSSSNTGYGTRGYMMLPSTTPGYDPGHRFLVYVKEGETVYFSFRATQNDRSFGWYYDSRTDGESNKFPVGTSGQGRLEISTTGRSSTNNNLTPEEAVTGPREIRGSDGYTTSGESPKGGSFTNNTGADRAFWLEFNSSTNSQNYNFRITEWDVTVVNTNQEQQTGRVYCRYWSMYNGLPSSGRNVNPNSSSFHDDFTFFVPIDNTESESEGYFVKSINFGASNAGYGVFFANSTGPKNTGDVVEDRKSSSEVSNLYEFPVLRQPRLLLINRWV